ncbi:unnamed protein product [Scytosiphon promiscuus]
MIPLVVSILFAYCLSTTHACLPATVVHDVSKAESNGRIRYRSGLSPRVRNVHSVIPPSTSGSLYQSRSIREKTLRHPRSSYAWVVLALPPSEEGGMGKEQGTNRAWAACRSTVVCFRGL